jgi:Leucine Rich repeat
VLLSAANPPDVAEILPPELLERIYTHLAGESVTALSTCGYRKCLPLALTCRAYYAALISAVRSLAILPVGFASRRAKSDPPPPYPLGYSLMEAVAAAIGKRRRSASSVAQGYPSLTVDGDVPLAVPTTLLALPTVASSPPFAGPTADKAAFFLRPGTSRFKVSDGMVCRMVAALPNLEELELSLAVGLTDAGIVAVAELCPGLRALRVTGNSVVTIESLRVLSRACSQLHLLDMSYCRQMGDSAAPHLAGFLALQTLKVAKWNITDEFLRVLFGDSCDGKRLSVLHLACCQQLTDVGMGHIARGTNSRLRALSVRSCRLVGDDGLDAVVRHCPFLQDVDVSYNDNLTADGVGLLGQLPHLRRVHAVQCRNVTDATAALLADCVGLENVNLSWCSGLTDTGVHSLVSGCPHLVHVSIAGCRFVTDIGVETLVQLEALERVVVTYCPLLSDEAAKSLGWARNGPLREVDLRRCEGVSSGAVERLRRNVMLLHDTSGVADEDVSV